MGYYTDFKITFKGEIDIEELQEALEERSEYEFDVAISPLAIYSYERIKWYGYERDLIAVSKKFPKVLLIVEGEGEESGDYWRHYFKDGRGEKITPIVTWPESEMLANFDADQVIQEILTEN